MINISQNIDRVYRLTFMNVDSEIPEEQLIEPGLLDGDSDVELYPIDTDSENSDDDNDTDELSFSS